MKRIRFQEALRTVGAWVNHHQRELLLTVSVALIAWSSYNLGTLRALEPEPVTVTRSQAHNTATIGGAGGSAGLPAGKTGESVPLDARVVVSKNSSSRKYHYSWCGSGKRIKEENRVWFETAGEAEEAGYTLAGNCQ